MNFENILEFNLILPYIKNGDFKLGKDVYLCFSPERIDPGNKKYNTSNTPKIIGGLTPECSKTGEKLYSTIISEVITVSSPETAEMVKLLENTFRAINIGLANEVAIMCEKLGVNAWEVIDAAATKPFGFMKFSPGPGLGGHCIPIDPYYLSWKLKTLDYDARFIKLAGEINTQMPKHVFDIVSKNLNEEHKALSGSKILVIGVAYKKDINDIRESPSIDIIELLQNAGSKVEYYDPYVPFLEYDNVYLRSLNKLIDNEINKFDACLILTDHSNIDYKILIDHSKLIIDTRNVYPHNKSQNIKRLGEGTRKLK